MAVIAPVSTGYFWTPDKKNCLPISAHRLRPFSLQGNGDFNFFPEEKAIVFTARKKQKLFTV